MVNRNLIREFDVSEEDWEAAVGALGEDDTSWLDSQYVDVNQIVEGKIIRVDDEMVLVDVGYKSEGTIPRNEWEEEEEQPEVGQTVRVLIEDVEDNMGRLDDRGMIVLSKRKAEKIEKWMKVMETVHEGDVVSGEVTRKIKGGLLVDIGVNVFLPASQVDIRRPHDIGEYIGKTIECMVLKIDEARRNIVVSRRSMIEAQRAERKSELLKDLEVGQLRKGVVKNIADFGAFVDLGGIDGLLHITDMSWGRINHPSEMVKIDDELEVQILHIDYEKEKIALGLKQKSKSPWENVAEKYPVNSNGQGYRGQRDELRCVRQAGRRHRRPGAYQRDVVDQTHQPPQRAGEYRRRNRRRRAADRRAEAGSLARHEAGPRQPLGEGRRALSAGKPGEGQGSQPHQLRGVHRDRRRHRRPVARERHVVDPQDQPSQRSGREGPRSRVQGVVGRPGTSPHRTRV